MQTFKANLELKKYLKFLLLNFSEIYNIKLQSVQLLLVKKGIKLTIRKEIIHHPTCIIMYSGN